MPNPRPAAHVPPPVNSNGPSSIDDNSALVSNMKKTLMEQLRAIRTLAVPHFPVSDGISANKMHIGNEIEAVLHFGFWRQPVLPTP